MSLDAHVRLQKGSFRLDAELHEPASGVTALFGPSGCGKTTLLRAIAGLEPDARGHCRLGGVVWQDADVSLPPHEREVGVVFQDTRLFTHLDVEGNLRYASRRAGDGEASAVVELLGLGSLLRRMPATLSGGERQRVAIGRALLSRPRILLLDEPLAALDLARKDEILPYLSRLQSDVNLPVLYVTHSLDEVIRLADRLVLMEEGRTIAAGLTAEMLARLDLPLSHRQDAGVVLIGTIAGHEEPFHLTRIAVGRQTLATPRLDGAVGEVVRLRVQARDVSVAVDRPTRSSILNIVPAVVEEVGAAEQGLRVVRLSFDGATLLARISERSFAELGLRAGAAVFAQIKGVALE